MDASGQGGSTDGDGFLIATIPPDAAIGEIRLGEGEKEALVGVNLGCIDPPETITGIQARLNNLGYFCGNEDGVLGEMTRSALQAFQEDSGLAVMDDEAATVDGDTIKKLEAAHFS